MAQIPIYEVQYDENDIMQGLMAVSFVDEPAIEVDFVALSKEEPHTLFFNRMKREIVSPILIPNQLILRRAEDGSLYYLRWSAETIKRLAYSFLLTQSTHRVTINHPLQKDPSLTYSDDGVLVDDVYCKELWIIDDEKTDKANTQYGYHLPKGTLMIRYKVNNRKLWGMIENGEVKGLSVEALCNVKNINETINYIKMKNNKEKFLNKIISFFNEISDELGELQSVASADETESGEVSLKYYIDDSDYIEVLADGTCIASDGSEVADGEYPLADGNILVVVDGKFAETKESSNADEEEVEAPIAEEKNCEEEDKKEKKEEENQEEVEVEPSYTLVEIEVEGEIYNVPQPIYDYIRKLEEGKSEAEETSEAFRTELARLQSMTPSAKKAEAKINQGKDGSDLVNVINKLNRR